MALHTSTIQGTVFGFTSSACEPKTLHVAALKGRDSLSNPYRFEIDLVSQKEDLDGEKILAESAHLSVKQGIPLHGEPMKRGIQTLKTHGMLQSFIQAEKGSDWVAYHAVLVPRLWKLKMRRGNRIFQSLTVPQIVEDTLKDNGLTSDDYDLSGLAGNYPIREYVVQYTETDFDFISRWLEHEGIFYYFRQTDDREVIVFGDSTNALETISGETKIRYRRDRIDAEGPTADWFGAEYATSFRCEQNQQPAEVVLNDYNWRKPTVDLKVTEAAAAKREGSHYVYGLHYKTPEEGRALAKVTAEGLKSRATIFRGSGQVKSFYAGGLFELADHYRSSFNRKYLITEVRYQAEQGISAGEGGVPIASMAAYENMFVCTPSSVPFRPERLTLKPKITGTINAVVDAGGDGEYAEMDDQGRYKVRLPYDLKGSSGGRASRYVRMAQPYAGKDEGMHFPLRKGTEVLLTHIDGDPDRPIISGSVPNPDTGSPITSANQTQCMIKTPRGNKITLEDEDGNQRIKMETPYADTVLQLGSPNFPSPGIAMATVGKYVQQIQDDADHMYGANVAKLTVGVTNSIFVSATASLGLSLKTDIIVGGKTLVSYGLVYNWLASKKVEKIMDLGLKVSTSKMNKVGTFYITEAGQAILEKAPLTKIQGTNCLELESGPSAMVMKNQSIEMESLKIKQKAKNIHHMGDAEVRLESQGGSIVQRASTGIHLTANKVHVCYPAAEITKNHVKFFGSVLAVG